MNQTTHLFLIGSILFNSCTDSGKPTPENTTACTVLQSVEYIPIAVVAIENSEPICRFLSEYNIVCFTSGSVAYAVHVREDQAEEAFKLLRNRKDWDVAVWSNGVYQGKNE
jgi:hypothetical protein